MADLSALNDAQNALDSASSQPWTPELVAQLSYSVLAFSLIGLILATALLWGKKASAMALLRVFGIVSIIGVSALLLITGYSREQLTPIVGLFGAIAGYLLGKDTGGEKASGGQE